MVDGMNGDREPGMSVLGEDECWRLLAHAEVGRLAVAVRDTPEIYPVNFVVDNRTLLFRTAEGTKLATVAVSTRVAFEIDGFDSATGEAWSVVVHGTATPLERLNDEYAVEELPLFPGFQPAGSRSSFGSRPPPSPDVASWPCVVPARTESSFQVADVDGSRELM